MNMLGESLAIVIIYKGARKGVISRRSTSYIRKNDTK